MDAGLSSDLLINIFTPYTPLHDGAVIVRGDRIAAGLHPACHPDRAPEGVGHPSPRGARRARKPTRWWSWCPRRPGSSRSAFDGEMIRDLDGQEPAQHPLQIPGARAAQSRWARRRWSVPHSLWPLRLLSLVTAIVLWLVFSYSGRQGASSERTLTNVPVTYNTPQGYILMNPSRPWCSGRSSSWSSSCSGTRSRTARPALRG